MKLIRAIEDIFKDIDEDCREFLEFAIKNPDALIPVYPKNDTTPSEAEAEARAKVGGLRNVYLDNIGAMPVFHICHIEREGIWVEFSLNPKFVRLLKELEEG